MDTEIGQAEIDEERKRNQIVKTKRNETESNQKKGVFKLNLHAL